MRQLHKILLLAALVGIAVSCVTEKRRGELSALGKLYHNTTARYNGYFNANELLVASFDKLTQQHQDNFKQILPVYQYVDVENPSAVAADLDVAIEKVSVVVNLHRESNWTDDCYLLVGKAQYLKKDYEAAEETLRYTVDQFSPEKMAEKAKKSRRTSASGSSKRSASARPGSSRDREEEPDVSQLSEKEKVRLAKRQEKERKKYNKEVRRKKKQEQRRRKRAKKLARKDRPEPTATPQQPEQEAGAQPQENAPAPPAAKEDKKSKKNKEKKKDQPAEEEEPEAGPESYFLKHRPVYQESALWLARTYIERERFEDAMRLILKLERDPGTFDYIRQELTAVKAHYFLRQEEYEQALSPLEDAISAAGRRTEKARYAFIIAQIHEAAGQERDAFAAYERALSYGPTYAMEFSSRLHLVESGWRAGTYSPDEAKNQLNRMLRDVKNAEYLDQIYYTLADIELESGNRQEGIQYLEQSLASSQANRLQRAESYLRLAELYLAEEQFVPAQHYFDSTASVLPSTDERYSRVKNWRDNLTDIAKNLEIISYQDSLLTIAAMSESEQKQLASRIKKERDAVRLAAVANAAAGQQPAAAGAANRGAVPTVQLSNNQAGQSTFFAYDERNAKRGKRDFVRKWGNRQLEDDWRRSDRQSFNVIDTTQTRPVAATTLPEDEISDILGDVPKTEAEKAAAEIKVQEAMFKLGVLYRERINNNAKCVEMLEELLRRFERTNYQAEAWYYLYLAYRDLNDPAKAQAYADNIMNKYSTSVYAKVLQDPNYAIEAMNEEKQLSRYYDETFAAFQRGEYALAQQRVQEAPRQFGSQNAFQPKFALLSAMCTGNLQGREAYVAALNDLIARYPRTPEQTRAREVLRLLGEQTAGLPGAAAETPTQFQVTDDELHYVLIVFKEDIGLNDSKVKVSNYHLQYHKLDKLSISNIYLGTEAETRVPILVVRRFKNKAEAMAYYQGVQRNKKDFVDPSISYELFAVSQTNYREVLRSKSVEGYREFFVEHYLK